MPLRGSVGDRIKELYDAQRNGAASRKRGRAQIIAIAYASKRRDSAKKRK